MPNPFTLILDALLQPAHFAAFLEVGWRNIGWAALAALVVLAMTAAFITLVLGQFIALGSLALLMSFVMAPALAVMIGDLLFITGSGVSSPRANAAFWLTRCQIAITPPLAVLLALTYSRPFTWLQTNTAAVLLLAGLFGLWIGGAVTVRLALHRQAAEMAGVRWVLVLGALATGLLALETPALHGDTLLLVPLCAGFALGLLRLLSYLWQAPLSLGLALAVWLGAPSLRLRALHPASYDELCLLPLPGLSVLLLEACAASVEDGGTWLLQMAGHMGQATSAKRVVHTVARQQALAHPLLFWLSTSDFGVALLERVAAGTAAPALIGAYAALGRVAAPEAWRLVLAEQHPILAATLGLADSPAVLALVATGAGVLGAQRWPDAVVALRAVPPSPPLEDGPIWAALAIMRAWVRDDLPVLLADRAGVLERLWAELEDLDGWPADLIAVMSEHLLFLLRIEQQRGAWIV